MGEEPAARTTPAHPEGTSASKRTSDRAGKYVRQQEGYYAFLPAPFPPRDLEIDRDLLLLQSRADLALGRLFGSTLILPNPDLFVFMYVRREAVLSSQIEGTEASLIDILEYEAAQKRRVERRGDVIEVSNYISAMRYGLERTASLPLSLRLIREIHRVLMTRVRGGEPHKTPGEFRRSQNWVGGPSPATARYVPPPVQQMPHALDELERFFHDVDGLPPLIKVGLVHAQFETIHPFLDGNGRVGRLLITFQLSEAEILREPILYLSIFFKRHRQEYYDRLQAIRDHGEWERWLAFFLEGVATVAEEATETAKKIVRLREEKRELLAARLGRRSGNGLRLLDHLFQAPYIDVRDAEAATELSQPAAGALVNSLQEIGVLDEVTGNKRNRVFAFRDYLQLFEERESRR